MRPSANISWSSRTSPAIGTPRTFWATCTSRAEPVGQGARAVQPHRGTPPARGLLSEGRRALQENPQDPSRRRRHPAGAGGHLRQAGSARRREGVPERRRQPASGKGRSAGRRRDRDASRFPGSGRFRGAAGRGANARGGGATPTKPPRGSGPSTTTQGKAAAPSRWTRCATPSDSIPPIARGGAFWRKRRSHAGDVQAARAYLDRETAGDSADLLAALVDSSFGRASSSRRASLMASSSRAMRHPPPPARHRGGWRLRIPKQRAVRRRGR